MDPPLVLNVQAFCVCVITVRTGYCHAESDVKRNAELSLREEILQVHNW